MTCVTGTHFLIPEAHSKYIGRAQKRGHSLNKSLIKIPLDKVTENPKNSGTMKPIEINLPIIEEGRLRKKFISNKIRREGRNIRLKSTKSIDLDNIYIQNPLNQKLANQNIMNKFESQEFLVKKFGIGITNDSTVVQPVFAPYSKMGIFINLSKIDPELKLNKKKEIIDSSKPASFPLRKVQNFVELNTNLKPGPKMNCSSQEVKEKIKNQGLYDLILKQNIVKKAKSDKKERMALSLLKQNIKNKMEFLEKYNNKEFKINEEQNKTSSKKVSKKIFVPYNPPSKIIGNNIKQNNVIIKSVKNINQNSFRADQTKPLPFGALSSVYMENCQSALAFLQKLKNIPPSRKTNLRLESIMKLNNEFMQKL